MVSYGQCPRCAHWSFEHLRTHSHCWECNYFPESDSEFSLWHHLEFRKSKLLEQTAEAEQIRREQTRNEETQ